jgi:hypothetical protein
MSENRRPIPDRENIPEIEVTPEVIEAAWKAIEPFAFTSMEGYDMEKALPAAFKAMSGAARSSKCR